MDEKRLEAKMTKLEDDNSHLKYRLQTLEKLVSVLVRNNLKTTEELEEKFRSISDGKYLRVRNAWMHKKLSTILVP